MNHAKNGEELVIGSLVVGPLGDVTTVGSIVVGPIVVGAIVVGPVVIGPAVVEAPVVGAIGVVVLSHSLKAGFGGPLKRSHDL